MAKTEKVMIVIKQSIDIVNMSAAALTRSRYWSELVVIVTFYGGQGRAL